MEHVNASQGSNFPSLQGGFNPVQCQVSQAEVNDLGLDGRGCAEGLEGKPKRKLLGRPVPCIHVIDPEQGKSLVPGIRALGMHTELLYDLSRLSSIGRLHAANPYAQLLVPCCEKNRA
jgi:hypothetical protein